MPDSKITVDTIQLWSVDQPLLAVTAYDYPTARHLDECGVEIVHVGDSLGMVALGFEDTTEVTMADMLHATAAAARGTVRALLTADLPYRSYETVEDAVRNSQALMDAGADAVKMEGGASILQQVRAVIAEGIPVQGHLGMLPQRIREEGGYRKKGKTEAEADKIIADACLLESEGVFSIVLEAVTSEVAAKVTETISIPTIGIASGSKTTGQIQVITDILGTTPWFQFPHVKAYVDGSGLIRQAVASLRKDLAED
ncbi:MAG: 3-methyl-2-oxobutanoate hydroxymethyltransferase [Verrucomicrobiota bacterium]